MTTIEDDASWQDYAVEQTAYLGRKRTWWEIITGAKVPERTPIKLTIRFKAKHGAGVMIAGVLLTQD